MKLGLKYALIDGEKTALSSAPKIENGDVLIPADAASALGIECSGEYIRYSDIPCPKVYSMDMILVNRTEPFESGIERDKRYMVSVARRFVFDIPHVDITAEYAPAAESDREKYRALGEHIYSLLKAHSKAHPYILASKESFSRIREAYLSDEDTYLKRCIIKRLNRLPVMMKDLPEFDEETNDFKSPLPPTGYGEDEYDEGGRHTASETLVDKGRTLAIAYHATGDNKYAYMAYRISAHAIKTKHWGPGHFLNCAGAAGFLSCTYDWLSNVWEDLGLDTSAIRYGIYTHGIHHAFNSVILDTCDFPSEKQGSGWRFKAKPDNWNTVCNSLTIISCLAMLGDGPDKSITEEMLAKTKELLGACLTSLLHEDLMLNQYAPDGSYVESNSYWAYGTSNLARLMGAFHTALGSDLGIHNAIGLNTTCYYAMNTESPECIGWNYHDGHLTPQDTHCFNIFATLLGDNTLFAIRKMDIDENGKNVTPVDILFHPEVLGKEIPELKALPLSYHMKGIDALAVRSGWEKGSLFAGIMGGENPEGGSHDQLDSGSFVYHNLGVMWFCDLGFDNYNMERVNGEGYFSNYGLYKRNAEGNNVLSVKSLPYGQRLGGRGVIAEIKETDDLTYCIIDNTSVYDESVVSAKRGMLIKDRRTLVISDRVEFNRANTAHWVAHYSTDIVSAELKDGGKTCRMTSKSGKHLTVKLLAENARFEIKSTYDYLLDGTAPANGEHDRKEYERLVVVFKDVTSLDMSVVIDTEENDYNEHIPAEMWKNL